MTTEKSFLLKDATPDAEPTLKSTSTDLIVPDDYPTIQEAVNAAEDGDTIIIREGIYPVKSKNRDSFRFYATRNPIRTSVKAHIYVKIKIK